MARLTGHTWRFLEGNTAVSIGGILAGGHRGIALLVVGGMAILLGAVRLVMGRGRQNAAVAGVVLLLVGAVLLVVGLIMR